MPGPDRALEQLHRPEDGDVDRNRLGACVLPLHPALAGEQAPAQLGAALGGRPDLAGALAM